MEPIEETNITTNEELIDIIKNSGELSSAEIEAVLEAFEGEVL